MTTQPKNEVKIKQLEGELISHENTINSLNERIALKNEIIAAIKKPGRPDAVVLVYGDREITVPIEEPNKYDELEGLFIKMIQGDVETLRKAIALQQKEKAETEKQIAELKK